LCEAGVGTSEGVKVPDVVAITRIRGIAYQEDSFFPEAPEMCVEVLSHSNSPEEIEEKRRLYAERGCREFWNCSEAGQMTFLDAKSGRPMSEPATCPAFPGFIALD
jgi:hypothetical protein